MMKLHEPTPDRNAGLGERVKQLSRSHPSGLSATCQPRAPSRSGEPEGQLTRADPRSGDQHNLPILSIRLSFG